MFKKIFVLYILLFWGLTNIINAQTILRQTLGCLGFSQKLNDTFIIQQSIGQPSSISVLRNENMVLSQGFLNRYIYYKTNPYSNIQVFVYPNPSNDFINIQVGGCEGLFSLIINDLSGREITNTIISSIDINKVCIKQLNPGLYLFNIFSEKHPVFQGKFIKIH